MDKGYPKSVSFTESTPEECYRKYYNARLSLLFDEAHYPTLDKFWLHEGGKYTLVVVYGHDATPNM